MAANPEKDQTSVDEVGKQVQKKLEGDEAVAAAIDAINARMREFSQKVTKATAPEFEDLGKVVAARLLAQHQEEQKDKEQVQAAIRWIEDKWGDQPCPYCLETEWQVGTPGEIALSGGEVMSPAFPVMCGNCGHTTYVNAIRAGLLPQPGDTDK